MSRRIYRWGLAGSTGTLWLATIGAAAVETDIKIYMTIWLATLLCSLWSLTIYLTRPDHVALAHARTRMEQARVNEALIEESYFHARRARNNRGISRVV